MNRSLLAAALILIFSSQGVFADQEPRWGFGFGVGPNISNIDAVGDELKSSVGAALWATREWGEMNRLDFTFDYFKFSESGQDYPSLNVAYGLRFFKDSRLKPFLLGGVGFGQANNFPRSDKSRQTCFNLFARGGVDNLLFGEKWSVGLMIDFEHVFMDGNDITSAQLALPMLTFMYRFSSEKKQEPLREAVRAPKPRIDSDGDGVYDDKDECPNTPRGKKVNSIGCEIKQKVTKTLKVEFDTAKATIRNGFMHEVDEFGKFMSENSDLAVTIEGHTDSVGSRNMNLDLSRRRANSVRNALIERWNLDPNRLKAVGYGPDKPVADNSSPAGRQLNRRVNAVLETYRAR